MVRSKRRGFTLIELIFAIVVISITVISLPMMNQVLSSGMSSNLVQEAIFEAATQLNEATTAHWDDNSLEPNLPNSLARVIDNGRCETDSSLLTYRQMPGHISQPFHRRCLDSSTTVAANSNSDDNVTSLDDMIRTNKDVITYNIDTQSDAQSGYKTNYKVNVNVESSPYFNGSNNPNMKKIIVTIQDKNGNLITKLFTYSANIGEVDFYKKAY